MRIRTAIAAAASIAAAGCSRTAHPVPGEAVLSVDGNTVLTRGELRKIIDAAIVGESADVPVEELPALRTAIARRAKRRAIALARADRLGIPRCGGEDGRISALEDFICAGAGGSSAEERAALRAELSAQPPAPGRPSAEADDRQLDLYIKGEKQRKAIEKLYSGEGLEIREAPVEGLTE